MKIYNVVTDVVNDVKYSRKSVNTRVVISQFITLRLSTGKQRRHMINVCMYGLTKPLFLGMLRPSKQLISN